MGRTLHTPTPNVDRFEIDWNTLCKEYAQSVEDYIHHRDNDDVSAQRYVIASTANTSGDRFWGVSHTEMVDYIRNGYEFPTSVDPSAIPMVEYEREHSVLNDDPLGEFQYDLYIAGDTDYYRNRPLKKNRAGIRLLLGFGWRAGTPARVIGDYGAWVGALIKALQAKGHDLEVCVYTRGDRRYISGSTPTSEHYVWLSKFGERIMPSTYSALFTPGAYRHFFFYYYGLEEERVHREVTVH